MNKKITCVSRCLLSDPAGRILLLKRRKESTWGAAQWQLPGGKISWAKLRDKPQCAKRLKKPV